jgi:DNA polymerase-3 subunit epsilon
MDADLEAAAAALDASGDYRVLRRLKPREEIAEDDGATKKLAIILDVETTGLDQASDEIIELGMLKFSYGSDGRIYRVVDTFSALRQPRIPIPAEITRLTGITADMVAGKSIDADEVDEFVADAVLIIAHNAGFDRPFCERSWGSFSRKHWACSSNEVDWQARGHAGTRLGYLLSDYRLFHDGHRALEDCRAVLEILSRPLPPATEPPLKALLESARIATIRIWAEGAPFDHKDTLKARGYRWSDGSHGTKAWWKDVPEHAADAELVFLHHEIYGDDAVNFPTRRLTARDRFSDRR